MLSLFAAGLWVCHILPGLIFIAFGLVGQFQASMIASILEPHLPKICPVEDLKPLRFDEDLQEGDFNEEEK